MKGNSDSKFTNKTEFMRYLDANPEAITSLAHKFREYHTNFKRGAKFGDWLRQKYLPHFIRAYKNWWLKHPKLFGSVYKQQESLSV